MRAVAGARRSGDLGGQAGLARRRSVGRQMLAYVGLSVICATMLAPLAWMASTSLKRAPEVLRFPPRWLPREPLLVRLEGRQRAVEAARVGGQELEVAVLEESPAGVRVQVLAPPARAGQRLVVRAGSLRLRERIRLQWRNYAQAWSAIQVTDGFWGLLRRADAFAVFYANSLFVSTLITAGQVLTSALAGYAFARLRFPGRDQLFLGYLGTLMVPAVVTMIPVFALLSRLRLTNTYAALVLPGMFSAFGTFMLRQFFLTVPRELEEAALIDGCSRLGVWWHVALPLCRPALAALTIFAFLHSWNEFMWPLIVIDDLRLKTLPIGLSYFQDAYGSQWNLLMAASVVVMLPVLVVFALGQRYFIRGIVLSGLKA